MALMLKHSNSTSKAGGVWVKISDNYCFTILGKEKLDANCKDLWLQVDDKNSNKTIILGFIYRHPKGEVKKIHVDFTLLICQN